MQTERSIPDLAKDMAFHLGDMFRNELKLARVEATEGLKSFSGAFAQLAVGAVVGASALTVGLMALAFGLAEFIPLWAALGSVSLLGGAVAWIFIKAGQKALNTQDLSLPRTREHVSRDIKSISEHVH